LSHSYTVVSSNISQLCALEIYGLIVDA